MLEVVIDDSVCAGAGDEVDMVEARLNDEVDAMAENSTNF